MTSTVLDVDGSWSSTALAEAREGLDALRALLLTTAALDGDASASIGEQLLGDTSCEVGKLAGCEFLRRFEIVETLGEGGSAVVMLARDRQLKRLVAVKVFGASIAASVRLQRRFIDEAQAMAELKHPNIVPIYDAGAEGALWYLVMEHCDGGTLAEWLATNERRPTPPALAAKIIVQLADALRFAHARGRLHHDVKPANVLLERDADSTDETFPFVVKLADFGLSERTSPSATEHRAPRIVGTPRYMSPEQARGESGEITVQSDIYGVGAVLYELLTGQPPFAELSDETWWNVVGVHEPLAILTANPAVPRDLAAICQRCLFQDATQRYPTAADLCEDLQRFLTGCPVVARPVGPVVQAARWCLRHPLVTGWVVSLLIAVAAGSSAVLWQWHRAEQALVVANVIRDLANERLDEAHGTLVTLGWALDESLTWSDSTLTPDHDFREALRRDFEKLIASQTDVSQHEAVLAMAYRRTGHELIEAGQADEGLARLRQSLAIWYQLLEAEPQNRRHRRCLALTQYYYWLECQRIQRGTDAIVDLESGTIVTTARYQNRLQRIAGGDLARLIVTRGDAAERGKTGAGLVPYLQALAILEALLASNPDDLARQQTTADLREAIARCYVRRGENLKAVPAYEAACVGYVDLRRRASNEFQIEERLCRSYVAFAEAQQRVGNTVGPRQALENCLELQLGVDAKAAISPAALLRAAELAYLIAQLPPPATESNSSHIATDWQRSRELWRRVATSSPLNPACERALARANRHLAGAKMASDAEAARGFLAEAIASHEAAGIGATTPRDEIEQYIHCRLEAAKLDEQSKRVASARQHVAELLASIEQLAAAAPSESWLVFHVDRIRQRFAEFP